MASSLGYVLTLLLVLPSTAIEPVAPLGSCLQEGGCTSESRGNALIQTRQAVRQQEHFDLEDKTGEEEEDEHAVDAQAGDEFARCSDDPGWADKDGYGCGKYAEAYWSSCKLQLVDGVMKGTSHMYEAYFDQYKKPGQKNALRACKACGKCNPEGPLMRASQRGWGTGAKENATHQWVFLRGSVGCGKYDLPSGEKVNLKGRTTVWKSKKGCEVYSKDENTWSLKCQGVDLCSFAAEGALPLAGVWTCTDGSTTTLTHFRDDWVPMLESNPDKCWKDKCWGKKQDCCNPFPIASQLCAPAATPRRRSPAPKKKGPKKGPKQDRFDCSTTSEDWSKQKARWCCRKKKVGCSVLQTAKANDDSDPDLTPTQKFKHVIANCGRKVGCASEVRDCNSNDECLKSWRKGCKNTDLGSVPEGKAAEVLDSLATDQGTALKNCVNTNGLGNFASCVNKRLKKQA